MPLADGAQAYRQGLLAGLMPDPPLRVDEWTQDHAYIPAEGNAEPGKYDVARTPFARQVLRVLSPSHPTNRVVVMGASQLLKTQTAMCWMMASVDAAAANILALMPTLDLARRLSMRINNTIKVTRRVAGLFSAPRSRHGKNTDDTKTFRGGTVYISTAGSAANLAEIPARYGYGDEIDDWEDDLQGQGDPIEVFENRGSTYGRNRKWYYSSSPKRSKEFSKILKLYQRGNQQTYHVPCPHCGEPHQLVWENMRWDANLERAWMVCPACGAEIEEHHKSAMLRDAELGGAARWVAGSTSVDGTESFTISQLYAPMGWTSWLDLARLYVQAEDALKEGDGTKMAAFYNTRLALCYDITRSNTTPEKLAARAEDYPLRVVPDRALVLTAYVDTQPDRLEVQTEAWGPDMEHWVIDHQVLVGSPTQPPSDPQSVWARLDEIISTPLMHASGTPIKISAYGIDSGGHNTQDVYNYGAARMHQQCVITKGSSRPNRPIIASRPSNQDVDWGGSVRQGAAELWLIGTDVAKDWLFFRIELPDGPGAMHWSKAMPAEWYEQMCAESLVHVTRSGVHMRVWRKRNQHARNEAIDITVGNLALAHKLRLHTWSAADWRRLRLKLIPDTGDLFAAPQPAEPPVAVQDAPAPAAAPTAAPTTPPAVPAAVASAAVSAAATPSPHASAPRRRIYSQGIRI